MMTSFRCYDDSGVNANLLIINFCLCLVKLWKSFFHIFIDSDIVKRGQRGGPTQVSRTSVWSPKNCIETP